MSHQRGKPFKKVNFQVQGQRPSHFAEEVLWPFCILGLHLKRNVGLALLAVGYTDIGTEVEGETRGKRLKAAVAAPFYKRDKK